MKSWPHQLMKKITYWYGISSKFTSTAVKFLIVLLRNSGIFGSFNKANPFANFPRSKS